MGSGLLNTGTANAKSARNLTAHYSDSVQLSDRGGGGGGGGGGVADTASGVGAGGINAGAASFGANLYEGNSGISAVSFGTTRGASVWSDDTSRLGTGTLIT